MKLGNIVTNDKINVPPEFNVVKTIEEIIQGIPTLIIGYDLINKLYPEFDITNISINTNTYWTFKRTERRDKFEEDLFWFMSKVYQDLTKQVKYVFVDPIQYRSRTLYKIIRKIYSIENKIAYIHLDMVYIYGDKIIFGVDLKLLRYMSVNVDKIIKKIKNTNVFLDDDKILIEYKKNVGKLEYQVKFIPYLYSITNEQNTTISFVHSLRKD